MDQSATPPGVSERWLPVPGWEDLYEVSDCGRVRALPRQIRTIKRGTYLRPMRILAPTIKGEYFYLTLGCKGRSRHVTVHGLVAEAFLGPRPVGHDVCHGPGGKLDNSLGNLSYGTRSKNMGPDRWRDGTIRAGVENGNAKLTEEIVRECRRRVADGEQKAALAREFGVSKVAMIFAVRGDTWKHVA